MTDDLVKRLRNKYASPQDVAEAASRIEELEKALLEIAFMEDVAIQSEQHDADLWRFRKIAMRAISKGRQK